MTWESRLAGEGSEVPEDLLASPRNWRIHPAEQEKALSSILNSVGVVQRVIVNARTSHVLDGHLRVAMAIREGVPEIPVQYVDLSDEEEAVILATFDQITGMAGTDREKLDEVLAEARESEAAQSNAEVAGLLESLLVGNSERARSEGYGGGEREVCPECGQPIRSSAGGAA
jgi:hypothetical protein